MVITIDGPAGTGKSTVARLVADELGFDLLDTGAMYRAVGLAALRRGVALDDAAGVEAVADSCRIDFDWSRRPPEVLLNGERVAAEIRTPEVSAAASRVAGVPGVRRRLVDQQRAVAGRRPKLVSEGRDQGSVVFPDATLKFYLDADPTVRARRRALELGPETDVQQVLRDIHERDLRDRSRSAGPLAVPAGAQVIDTTYLEAGQVAARIIARVRSLGEPRP